MNQKQELREDAQRAADYLKDAGWCQGVSTRPGGARCAAAVANQVTTGYSYYGDERASRLKEAFRRRIKYDSIGQWNDAPGRTAEEVIAVYEDIAKNG